jgi:hypothetical protein
MQIRSFRWPNYIVTLPRYFSFRLPHLNINTGAPSDELDKNIQQMSHFLFFSQWNRYSPQKNWTRKFSESRIFYFSVNETDTKRRGHIFFEWNKCLCVGHNIEMGPPKDHPSQICFNLVQQFQRRRFPFTIMSDSLALHSRWLMLQKIEMSSIVHCCFILNQNEVKF